MSMSALAAAVPHPRHRVPVVGDVFGVSAGTPVQDSMRLARELGPIFVRRFFGREVVFVSGADLVAELADETRFAKHVGLGVEGVAVENDELRVQTARAQCLHVRPRDAGGIDGAVRDAHAATLA